MNRAMHVLRSRRSLLWLVLPWLVTVLAAALALATVQRESRADLERRFEARAELGAAQVRAFLDTRRRYDGGRAAPSLGAFVGRTLPHAGARVFLADDRGRVVAGVAPAPARGSARPAYTAPAGRVAAADGRRVFAQRRVPGTRWRLVLTAPERVLFEPVGGAVHWLPWAALALIAAGGLALVRVGARLVATRRELDESEALHRRIIASLPDAVVVALGPDGRFTIADGPGLRAIGVEPEQLLGRHVTEVLPAGRAEPLLRAQRVALAGETSTFDHTTASGRTLATEVAPLRDDAGAIVGALLVGRDVTEGRAAQRERREAEERFQRAFDAAPGGMALVALDGTFLRVNDALGETLGRTPAALVGRRVCAVTHPGDVAALTEVFGEEADARLEQRVLRPDGEERQVELTTTLVRDGRARALYLVLQLVDVTERREAERALRALADHDGLTGLLNRRRFREELAVAATRPAHGAREASLLALDLDQFKLVNDRFGHAAGDALLVAVADTLRRRLRSTDAAGRLGGDEFVVLLADTPPAAAALVARHLQAAIAEHGPAGHGDEAVAVRASIGVVAVPPGGAATAAELLASADEAMYADKRGDLRPAA